jgi:hypothetical protein
MTACLLKVVSAILGRNINAQIHLIPLQDPLASRPIAGLKKKHVSVVSLFSEIVPKNIWYYQPLKTKINSIPTDHRQGVGFCDAFMIVFTGCLKQRKEGRAGSVFSESRFKYHQK